MRDYNYIAQMNALNDPFWRDTEKWFYYKYEHQNLIIPVGVICFLMLFTAELAVSLTCIGIAIALCLIACHLDNLSMDNDPWVQMNRKSCREIRRKLMNMDV